MEAIFDSEGDTWDEMLDSAGQWMGDGKFDRTRPPQALPLPRQGLVATINYRGLTPRNRCKMHVCVLLPYSVKRADDKSASAKTTKTNAP